MGWDQADGIAMDAEASREVFQYGHIPAVVGGEDETTKFEENIPLTAFTWVVRRFIQAPKFCLVSGGVTALMIELWVESGNSEFEAVCL
jgi:hypothetical protein